MRIVWRPRDVPLAPVAAAARGPAARRLAARVPTGAGVVAGKDVLVVLSAELWIDGIIYLGRDPAAPGLLLPTALLPGLPVDLLERALLRRFAGQPSPLALLSSQNGSEVVPVGHARAAPPGELARWAAA